MSPPPDPSVGRSVESPEVIAMLTAAEQIADGLADLARAIYDCDSRWKDQLAAANAVSVRMYETRREAESVPDDGPWEDEDPRHYAHRMGDSDA